MAELAAGAVQTLLGVIRDETHLLGRVETDVQFIKEEMESMNSFLLHLSRTVPPGGEHGDQVRTWMKQVRELAHDCSNSIDRYLQRGNPAVYRTRGPLYFFWWVPWYLQKLAAQHSAAIQLGELKERARDVGKRRLRYGVQIPKLGDVAETLSAPTTGAPPSFEATGDVGEDEEDDGPKTDDLVREQVFAEPRTTDECADELVDWLLRSKDILHSDNSPTHPNEFRAIAIAAPVKKDEDEVIKRAIGSLDNYKFECRFQIKVSTDSMMPGLPAGPLDILEAIQKQLTPPEPGSVDEEPKMKEIDGKIEQINEKIKGLLDANPVVPLEPLDILLHGIQELSGKDKSKDQSENKIEETAKKIKDHVESGSLHVALDPAEYERILRELLAESTEDKEEATAKSDDHYQITKNIREIMKKFKSMEEATDKQSDDQIVENIKEITEEIMVNKLKELLLKPNESAGKQEKKAADKLLSEKRIEQITKKINGVLQEIKRQLQSNMAEKIKGHLVNKKTLILLLGMDYSKNWGEIMEALRSLGCATRSAVVVITKYTHESEKFGNTKTEPILCYLAGSYYRKVLKVIKQPIKSNTGIFRGILECCEQDHGMLECSKQDDFNMKIFVRAMYANPRRNKEELHKLHDALVLRGSLEETIDKWMIKFSYNDLPKDYKTCLLYLAIFDKDDNINRSRLVGRWVVEGLITRQDWPSSVLQAERCFDALVDRQLICHGDTSATAKAKSCQVHPRVCEFITKMAKKEHFVGTRLSHRLAKHFSVLSDIRARSSDTIEKFLRNLSGSPQLPQVKVLDLEGCKFEENCLKHICNKMLLLKYLSLRKTNITKLPKEIKNLHQLEVLDIRENDEIGSATTRDVLLLKLKRLLAGHKDPSPTTAVQIPHGIGKMTNLEVLSSVTALPSRGGDGLKDIGNLWQLRKLGVVIEGNKESHLSSLLGAIGDLNECLESLSITLTNGGPTGPATDFKDNIVKHIKKNPPKFLKSLSINGSTSRGQLLPLLVKGDSQTALAKVTLCDTFLNQGNMEFLAGLPNLRCLRLKGKAYTDSKFSFKCAQFKKLKFLHAVFGETVDIRFDIGAAPELNKIVISSNTNTSVVFPSGIKNLTKLKELEINGRKISDQVWKEKKRTTTFN